MYMNTSEFFKKHPIPAISHAAVQPEVIPLTGSQLGIYMNSVGKPDSVIYNIPGDLALPAGTDRERFIAAVENVTAKHPAFFAVIGTPGGVPSMILRRGEVTVTVREAASFADAVRDFSRPFDLEKGPLYRFAYVCTPEGDHFLLDVHHIIFDGSSVHAFLRQIAAVYAGEDCPEETLTVADCAAAEGSPVDPARKEYLERYFEEKFGDIDADSKPVPDQIVKDGHTDWSMTALELRADGFPEAAAAYTAANGISENALFLGAFGYALAKYNGAGESVFATAYHGRTNRRLENTVGMFVQTLPFACRFREDMTPAEYLRTVYEDYFITKQNNAIPFSELAARYGVNLNVSFVFQAGLLEDVPMENGLARFRLLMDNVSASDLEVTVLKKPDSYRLECRALRRDYTPGFAADLLALYKNVLIGMLRAETLGEISLTDEESEAPLDRFNETEKPYDREKTVVALFREQAAKTPEVPCLVYGDRRFSYAEVDEITDRLAKHLLSRGIGKGSVVGVLIPRCEYMLLCSLGVLKAGAAYLPLDPGYPPERLNLMTEDSGASFLLTTPALTGIIGERFTGERMMTEEIPALPDREVSLPEPSPEDLFILLYTSGSTGTPKGVMFAHSNTMVTAAWERDFYRLGVGSHVTAYASYGFDANVFDTYATVTSGATLYIISDEMRLDLPALQTYFRENRITHATMTTQVGRQFAAMGGAESLEFLNVAGEKLTPIDPPEGFRLYNLYGPTEGSILVTGFHVDRFYQDVPIGKAIDNVKLYVVDPLGRRLPAGAVGELWVSGAHVTKGYLNRPEKTAEAYGKNPFRDAEKPGYDKIYRTGDIVRMMHDGNVQFIGRKDGQVKVRGFRVELTEVEEVIRRFAGIRDATVAAFDDPAGGKFIAAYVVADTPVDVAALNGFIAGEKPPYMVPAVTVQLDKIPLNQNQKVNKKALPKPERKAEKILPPENEMQQKIYDMAAEVIGHKAFGTDTDLFEAGLTSIGSLRLNVMLGGGFDLPIRLDDIKRCPTVLALEQLVLSRKNENPVYEKQNDYPLTRTQMGIYVECGSSPESVLYNMPLLLKLGKTVDTKKLKDAIRTAMNAHPYIKTTLFADDKGDIRALRRDDADIYIEETVCETLPAPEALVRPFLLLGTPLYRISILKTPEASYLFMDFHHIISDGSSEAILLADIDRAYAGRPVEAERYTGFEAALEEESARASDRFAGAKAYFDRLFTDCEGCCLPQKAPEKGKTGDASITRRCGGAGQVAQYCAAHSFTPGAFFNAAFGYTLSCFGQFEDVVFTTVYHGRNDSRLASSVTMLVKTLPVLLHTGGSPTVAALVGDTQKQLMDSMANDLYSFAEISAAYGIKADVLFVYQGDDFSFDRLCKEAAESLPVQPTVAKAPLTVSVYLKNGGYEIVADYRETYYSAAFIESFLDVFEAVLSGFCGKEKAEEISLLSPAAEAQLREMNDTARPYEKLPAYRFVEREAAAHPEKLAVCDHDRNLSYDAMNRLANRIAHALLSRGVRENSIVGMMLPRTVMISVCELGILKAGGAFLGLLPEYPDERVEYCLSDADSRLLITDEAHKKDRPALCGDGKSYRTVTLEELLENTEEDDPALSVSPESLAYCIYTSGSTGNPKGVMISHRNLACCARPDDFTYARYHGSKGGQVVLALSSLSFDMSIFDNLLILMNGKTVCVASEREIHNPGALAELMLQNRVDMMAATPSFLTNILSIPEMRPAMRNIVTLVSGAEAFPAVLLDELKKLSPSMCVINGYGPSECTITCCAKELKPGESITIGTPSPNTAFYVTDRFGRVLPPYGCGELIICGDLVGRGYIKLPEKTAAAFFTLRGLPAYHSGDVVRLNGEGEVEFFGRKDNQVKLRGFRVELDEIEKCICSYEGILQSKVIVRNNGSEDFLAAFFTADRPVEPSDLTGYLKTKLTYYMVPDAIQQLPAMPLTTSGKIDKKALPEIKREKKKSSRRAPKKSLEEELCELFREVLSAEEFFADDNFFEMGGTSLSASKVTMQLLSRGFKVEYQDLFSNPTPELLAAYIAEQTGTAAAKAESPDTKPDSDHADQLRYNCLQYAAKVKREPLGDVLLTGAVGFLGSHILRQLLIRREGKIICLVRKGSAASPETRLKSILMYYFDNPFANEFADRITVLDADITDDRLGEILADVRFDTLINCAACVKHYAADNSIEHINVHGVENLIAVAKEKNARMIQISTTSVPGVHTEESWLRQVKMHENELFVIDDMDNQYCISKYRAELKMLEAIREGMRGKIIRVGNLMGRHSDGEFQINFETNAFLNALRGFATVGKCPVSHATDPMRFSPIDMTAKAVVLLAGTNDCFTAFHADSRFGFDEWQLVAAANNCGVSIVPVPDEEYYADYYRMLGDEKINARLQGLLTNDRPDLHMVETDNLFTANVLYRLGFSWPLPDSAYLERAINSLLTLDYFEPEEEIQ